MPVTELRALGKTLTKINAQTKRYIAEAKYETHPDCGGRSTYHFERGKRRLARLRGKLTRQLNIARAHASAIGHRHLRIIVEKGIAEATPRIFRHCEYFPRDDVWDGGTAVIAQRQHIEAARALIRKLIAAERSA